MRKLKSPFKITMQLSADWVKKDYKWTVLFASFFVFLTIFGRYLVGFFYRLLVYLIPINEKQAFEIIQGIIPHGLEEWGVFTAVSIWILKEQDRRRDSIIRAWQVILDSHNKPGDGGNKAALELLNNSNNDKRYPYFWLLYPQEDLSHINLSSPKKKDENGNSIKGAYERKNLSKVNLQEAYLNEANLEGADLRRANLKGADLTGANLGGANLLKANLGEVILLGTNLQGANLSDADLQGAKFLCVNLEEADLSGANLQGADLIGADLQGAKFLCVNLEEADLSGANLQGVNLTSANLQGANLSGANLQGVNLTSVNLQGANLSDADLQKAQLYGVNFVRIDLNGEDLKTDFWQVENLTVGQLKEALNWEKALYKFEDNSKFIEKIAVETNLSKNICSIR